jgi:hypothetical protein
VSYAFYYDVPGDEALYQRVKDRIGQEAAAGQLLHLVTKIDGGLRHVNVWQTKDDWQRYQRERVGPAVGAVLAASGIPASGAPPLEQELHLVDLEVGVHADPSRGGPRMSRRKVAATIAADAGLVPDKSEVAPVGVFAGP